MLFIDLIPVPPSLTSIRIYFNGGIIRVGFLGSCFMSPQPQSPVPLSLLLFFGSIPRKLVPSVFSWCVRPLPLPLFPSFYSFPSDYHTFSATVLTFLYISFFFFYFVLAPVASDAPLSFFHVGWTFMFITWPFFFFFSTFAVTHAEFVLW